MIWTCATLAKDDPGEDGDLFNAQGLKKRRERTVEELKDYLSRRSGPFKFRLQSRMCETNTNYWDKIGSFHFLLRIMHQIIILDQLWL